MPDWGNRIYMQLKIKNKFHKIIGFIAVFSAVCSAEDLHLFILSGQSNMARLDPNLTFTPAVESEFGRSNVIVVKDAVGGKPIRRWDKGWPLSVKNPQEIGSLYDRLMRKVKSAVSEKKPDTVTFIWMQGETDAVEKHGDLYRQSFERLVEQLQNDLGRKDIHLVIGRINDSALDDKHPDWKKVRNVQVAVAETYPSAAWVDTDDLNSGLNSAGEVVTDDLHLTVEGYEELGRRFADQAIALIHNNPS